MPSISRKALQGLKKKQAPTPSDLYDAVKKLPMSLEELCDLFNAPPKVIRSLASQIKQANVTVCGGLVGIQIQGPRHDEQNTKVLPTTGHTQKLGVVSDTHLGSKYCLRAQLQDCVNRLYDQGVRHILHPGDVLDGNYRHGLFELSHVGFDAQCQDAYETFPQLPGLHYHFISGNHDETFWANTGHSAAHSIERYMAHPPGKQKPRHDWHAYGDRGAFLRIQGVRVHLWHPRSGKAYAKSYKMQRLSEEYAAGEKPDITLAGHWHIFNYAIQRGIHLIACPTFQGGGSAFGKSLGGAPEIGGLILRYDLTEQGMIRDFNLSRISYYEREVVHHIRDEEPGVFEGMAP